MTDLVLKITNPASENDIPTVEWNYDEIKASLSQRLEKYDGLVYTAAMVTDAKKDRALLNKVAAAIDAERKRVKAAYLAPYETFEKQAKELMKMVEDRSSAIDAQIKAYDEARKQEKKDNILKFYEDHVGDLAELVPFSSIFREQWLNVSYRMSMIQEEITRNFDVIRSSIATIQDTCGQDVDACMDVYLHGRYDLAAAIAKHKQLEEIREAQAKRKADMPAKLEDLKRTLTARDRNSSEIPDSSPDQAPAPAPTHAPAEVVQVDVPAQTQEEQRTFVVDFRVIETKERLDALKAFLKSNGYHYGPVPHK